MRIRNPNKPLPRLPANFTQRRTVVPSPQNMPQFAKPYARDTQTGMPQFANPYAREFMGLGQAAANQMGLGQAAANQMGLGQAAANQMGLGQAAANQMGLGQAAANQMGLGQAAANQMNLGQAAAAALQRLMPRPQQRPTPGNYGGFNDLKGMGFNQYGFDPVLVNYLNEQEARAPYDAGISYSYDPRTQTFRGGSMSGPVTKTLAQMQEEAQTQKPQLPGMGRPQISQQEMEQQRYAQMMIQQRYAQPGQDYQTVSDQQIEQMQQMEMEPQRYAQRMEQAAMNPFSGPRSPYPPPGLRGMPGFGGDPRFPGVMPGMTMPYNPAPGNPPPGLRGMPGFGGDPRFPGVMPGMTMPYNPAPGNPPMPPQIIGGPANKMGPRLGAGPQQPMQQAQYGGPLGSRLLGAQMQQPQQRPMPGNYGGYNSIQGMGANQYGGFNSPPPGMGQMGMGQAAQQQPQTQNNMFGSFGGFNQAMGGGQNQGPNQQAQQEDQYGNFGGGSNQGRGGGGLF